MNFALPQAFLGVLSASTSLRLVKMLYRETLRMFIADYIGIHELLKQFSPVAFHALPKAMKTILDVIDKHPRGWPLKRKELAGVEYIFHIAIVSIAYQRIHVRYYIDEN